MIRLQSIKINYLFQKLIRLSVLVSKVKRPKANSQVTTTCIDAKQEYTYYNIIVYPNK